MQIDKTDFKSYKKYFLFFFKLSIYKNYLNSVSLVGFTTSKVGMDFRALALMSWDSTA